MHRASSAGYYVLGRIAILHLRWVVVGGRCPALGQGLTRGGRPPSRPPPDIYTRERALAVGGARGGKGAWRGGSSKRSKPSAQKVREDRLSLRWRPATRACALAGAAGAANHLLPPPLLPLLRLLFILHRLLPLLLPPLRLLPLLLPPLRHLPLLLPPLRLLPRVFFRFHGNLHYQH
ncbi:hypothetical protein R5R35_006924 [Gryllus longicercus]|uniref:Accessory gland protein n=1 Tax=Gryllus longicercus TaxID=2509291 RepID=A0AAN9Z2K9_9ORTH